MHKPPWRVLCWHHTRYLIIISQTITGLIVIGEILEHREEKCQVYWQGIFIPPPRACLSLTSFWSVDLVIQGRSFPSDSCGTTSSPRRDTTRKDELRHTSACRRLSVRPIPDFSLKRKGERSERPLKGQCEWPGLLSGRIVFCRKRSSAELWDC